MTSLNEAAPLKFSTTSRTLTHGRLGDHLFSRQLHQGFTFAGVTKLIVTYGWGSWED